MNREDLIIMLIKELWNLNTVQHEYQDNNNYYAFISEKDGDTLHITVTVKENKDKEEFEAWVDSLDDDIYLDAIDILEEDGINLGELYENRPEEAMVAMKEAVRVATESKINELKNSLIK